MLPHYYGKLHQRASLSEESVTSVARMKKALRVRLASTLAFVRGHSVCAIAKTTYFGYTYLAVTFSSGIQVLIMKSKLLSHCGLLCRICDFMPFYKDVVINVTCLVKSLQMFIDF